MKLFRAATIVFTSLALAGLIQTLHSPKALAVSQADFSSIYESSGGCGQDFIVNKQRTTTTYASFDCLHLVNTVKGSYVIKAAPSGGGKCPDATVDKYGPQSGVAVNQNGKVACAYFPNVNSNFNNPSEGQPAFDPTSSSTAGCADGSTTCDSTLSGQATKTNCKDGSGNPIFVATPGLNLNCVGPDGKPINPIYALLTFIINWAIRLLGVLAVLAIVVSGIQYITSQGNPDGIKGAKSRLTQAVVGLILLSLMFVILRFLGVA